MGKKKILVEESSASEEEEQVEEPSSDLEVELNAAEDALSKIDKDIQRLRKMDESLDEILKSTLFTRKEKKAFETSYNKMRDNMQSSVEQIVEIINRSKELWTEKQTAMAQMHQEDLLDLEVAKVWDESLKSMADRIEKLQKSLAFYNEENATETKEPRKKEKSRVHR
jgi:3-methyladenine DNA glycosylase/8-oxoguanine DNA glycosylase